MTPTSPNVSHGHVPSPAVSVAAGIFLTAREREVVGLAADHYAYKEIGARMGLSENTVRGILTVAQKKFRARSRGEMYRGARAMGITP
jgi:DNA-binding CsgD family transcriptional regulator